MNRSNTALPNTREIAVIGAGGWGTALANLLGFKGYSVRLWVYEEDLFHTMKKDRENIYYLPGVKILDKVIPTHSIEEAVSKVGIVVSASPSHAVRSVMKEAVPHVSKDAFIISVSKGIEEKTLMTMSEVIRDLLPDKLHDNLLVLSGPSFAKEVVARKPTAVVIASKNMEKARYGQKLFNTPFFRVYTNDDVKI